MRKKRKGKGRPVGKSLVRRGRVLVPKRLLEEKKGRDVTAAPRSFDEYLKELDLSEKQLAGKRVLDVGAGRSNFVDECRKRGIEAVAIDYMEGYVPGGRIRKRMFAEKMRFPDNSFDLVVSLHAVPEYSATRLETRLALFEMLRVLKVGGVVKMSPAYRVFQSKYVEGEGGIKERRLEKGPFFPYWVKERLEKAGFEVVGWPEGHPPRIFAIRKGEKADLKRLRRLFFGK